MQILVIIWEPNEKWSALSEQAKKEYLLSLDTAVNEARSHGVMTLGWSRVDGHHTPFDRRCGQRGFRERPFRRERVATW